MGARTVVAVGAQSCRFDKLKALSVSKGCALRRHQGATRLRPYQATIVNQNALSEANPHGKHAKREKCGLGQTAFSGIIIAQWDAPGKIPSRRRLFRLAA